MTRPLLLSGFMATGKSTVGRRVAELEGVPFEDLDARIEQRAGASISEIFESAGEAGFRTLEQSELDRALASDVPRVVALGGGALGSRAVRLSALEHACVVTLEASLDVVLARAGSVPRPLLAGADPRARASELIEARRTAYAECHARVDTSDGDVERAAREVRDAWRREPIAVAAGEHSYSVEVGHAVARQRLPALLGATTGTLVVTDVNVQTAQRETLDHLAPGAGLFVLPAGEEHKTPRALEAVWRAALARDLDRSGTFLAFGGGVVSDITGFAAATWMRGTRWLAVPTTLLSMVDASVGGKTAVDLDSSKNGVGAFWQPVAVVCDTALLSTEPERSFVSGLAEVVKSALVGDPELLKTLAEKADALRRRDPSALCEIVRRSVAVKARIVSRDEREQGPRRLLNLGHTLGHALEACTGYQRFTHGEAVSLGLVSALQIGHRLGVTPGPLATQVTELLGLLGLPTDLGQAPVAQAVELLARDKKRQGTYIHFVMVSEAGRTNTQLLPIEQLRRLALGP